MALTNLFIRQEHDQQSTNVPNGTALWISTGLRLIEDQ